MEHGDLRAPVAEGCRIAQARDLAAGRRLRLPLI
jgi:hypothetical protein